MSMLSLEGSKGHFWVAPGPREISQAAEWPAEASRNYFQFASENQKQLPATFAGHSEAHGGPSTTQKRYLGSENVFPALSNACLDFILISRQGDLVDVLLIFLT